MSGRASIVQFRLPRTASTVDDGQARRRSSGWSELGVGEAHDRTTGCATGACRASATGAARSRSSIATDCGIVPVPEERSAGRAARGRDVRPAGQSARPPSDLEARRLPALRRPGRARDRHVRHVRRIRPGTSPLLLAARADVAVRPRGGRLLDAGRPVYRRHRARRSCTCSIRASSPARMKRLRLSRPRRAVRRPVHPGHGLPRDLSARADGEWLLPGGGRASADGGAVHRRDRRAGRRSAASRR